MHYGPATFTPSMTVDVWKHCRVYHLDRDAGIYVTDLRTGDVWESCGLVFFTLVGLLSEKYRKGFTLVHVNELRLFSLRYR